MKKNFALISVILPMILFIFISCQKSEQKLPAAKGETQMEIKKDLFGTTPDGMPVDIYTLAIANGLKARIMTYGAIIVALEAPDRHGNFADVTLGYDSLAGYIANNPYFGAVVGRYGNRIANGRFKLNGVEYQLATNNGPNHLHGGVKGFDKVVWQAEPVQTDSTIGLKLTYLSPDGEEGYPGNLAATVTYTLTRQNELKVSYEATTDKATPINLTHHSYFNLAGQGDILGHELTLVADRFTPVDATLIPTGELKPVQGTPMDFTTPHAIGERIDQVPDGYDHNFVLNNDDGSMALAAQLYDPSTGRLLEIYTTEPGIQFYSGNFLDGTITGKAGKVYQKHYGLCLETQHFPNSPNQAQFPPVILYPGVTYTHETVHRFLTR